MSDMGNLYDFPGFLRPRPCYMLDRFHAPICSGLPLVAPWPRGTLTMGHPSEGPFTSLQILVDVEVYANWSARARRGG